MANLTISVEDSILLKARIRALEQGTSVNALLRAYLEHYAGLKAQRDETTRALLALSEASRSGHQGTRWTRDELHER